MSKNRCMIDAFNCNDDCNKCSEYDNDSSVEIRLFDHKTDKVFYKRLTENELESISDQFKYAMIKM